MVLGGGRLVFQVKKCNIREQPGVGGWQNTNCSSPHDTPPTWTCVLPVLTMGQSKMMPQDPLNHDWKERISTISIKTHFVVLGECKVTLAPEKV